MGIPSNDLNISQAGYVTFDGVATFSGRTFQAGTGITLTNASGVAGNTTIAVSGSGVGQTITGNDGNALAPTAGNWNIFGADLSLGTNGSVTSGSGSTLTITSINTAKWIVDPTANRGTHTTVQGAINAASSGQTIFIRPGTYTENITLKAGVNLCAYISDSLTPNVTIVGKCTFTAAGTVSISGIRFQTNSDFLIAVTGSAASIVNLDYCYFNCTNNTGISFTSSSSSAKIEINNCQANLGTTGIALFSHSSSGLMNILQSNIYNTGGSTTASTNSAGGLNLTLSYFSSPITYSGTSAGTLEYCAFDLSAINATCLTFGGSGAQLARFCRFISGTASAVSISTTLAMACCTINSSNTNAVTGAGTLNYSSLAFVGTSSLMNTTTQVGQYTNLGKYKASSQPCFQVYVNTNITNVTGAGAAYPILFDTINFDLNSNITLNSAGRTIFTAPVAGKYLLNFTLAMNSLTVAMNAATITIVTTGQTFFIYGGNVGAIKDVNNTAAWQSSQIVNMAAGDTAYCQITIFSGAGNTAAVQGNNSGFGTLFSGHLVA